MFDGFGIYGPYGDCLLYTSDAADERSSVDLGGRRIIKKKTYKHYDGCSKMTQKLNTVYIKNKLTQ